MSSEGHLGGSTSPSSAARGGFRGKGQRQKARKQRQEHGSSLGNRDKSQHALGGQRVLAQVHPEENQGVSTQYNPIINTSSNDIHKSSQDPREDESNAVVPPISPQRQGMDAAVLNNSFNRPGKGGVCNLWKAGNCTYGERCKFRHPIGTNYPSQMKGDNNRQRSQNLQGGIGGDSCQPKGVRIGLSKNDEQLRQQAMARRRLEVETEARRLNKEREQAEKEAERKHRREQVQARRTQEAAVVEQYLASETSLITCSAGMEVQNIVTGFDLCRITIKNLPGDAQPNEIAHIFTQQGVDTSTFFVQNIRLSGGKKEAVVLTKADQGEAIALGLEGIEFRNEALSFEVSANASWSGMGAASQSGPSISVSWWMPSEINIVTYDTMEKAMRQVTRLNSKIWNNRRLRVSMNTPPKGHAVRSFVPESIMVFGCQPGSATTSGFQNFVESSNIKTLRSMNYDPGEVFETVRNSVSSCPGVQMHTHEVISDGSKVDGSARIKVQFNTWEQTKLAYDNLNKKQIQGGSGYLVLQCRLHEQFQYSIKILRQQYEVQKKQWNELSEKRADRDAHVLTNIGDRGDVFIKVVGKDKKATGSLKVRVESMLAGDKLDSTTHWHPSFASKGGRVIFDGLPETMRVFVRHDFKSRSLRVYGDRDRIEDAKRIIKDQVDRLAKMETTRFLDRDYVPGFMREGLGKLKELLGDENVTVIMGIFPYRVTVKGGVEAAHHLERIIAESRSALLDDALPGVSDKEACPICYDDVSNPEELGCGHTYCSGCLRHFLTSAPDTRNFPLVCVGNEARCKVPIAIPTIRRFLTSSAFQNLVEATFTAYIENHPQELKYCTTPDCNQIYRRRSDKVLLQCPSCFAVICSMCDEEGHEGMTCEERRIQGDPEEQERLNNELAQTRGFKKCPQCSVFIEKTEGCNHMTCKCGAHICWKCLQVFTAGTIYSHLRTVHGGIYDEMPPAANNAEMDDNAFVAMQILEIQRLERAHEAVQQQRPPAQPALHRVAMQAIRPPANNMVNQRAGAPPIQGLLWNDRETMRFRQEQNEAEIYRRRRENETRQEELERQRLRIRQEQQVAEARRRQSEGGWCAIM